MTLLNTCEQWDAALSAIVFAHTDGVMTLYE